MPARGSERRLRCPTRPRCRDEQPKQEESMSIGEEGGGSLDSADTSTDTSLDSPATSTGGTEFTEGTGETAAEQKLRLKWLGRDEEIDDPRKLADRFSDDYEIEFPKGPGGKPVKRTWRDLERDVQLSA